MTSPALLRNYTSPFTRARGIDNPVVFAGFILTDSEVGHGAFKIIPRLEVQVCDNGLTIEKDALKEVHLGARLDDGVVRWSADTRHAMAELAGKQGRDAGPRVPQPHLPASQDHPDRSLSVHGTGMGARVVVTKDDHLFEHVRYVCLRSNTTVQLPLPINHYRWHVLGRGHSSV